MWLLPWCPFWGDSHRGTPAAACEASLRSEGRAAGVASLMWGKCVTSSRLGWGGLSRPTSLALQASWELGI